MFKVKKLIQICIIISSVFLFPLLGICEKYDEELNLDCYLFKQRSQYYTAIAYVEDLNARVERCKSENNLPAFDHLTNLLLHTLITGGPFGLRSTSPSPSEWEVVNDSFIHIAGLTVISKKNKQTDDNRLQEIITGSIQSISSSTPNIMVQSNAIFSFIKDKIPNIDRTKLPTSRDFKEDEWFSFTSDKKVIIRDLRKDQEFYLLNTSPDGSCWMHSLACSNNKEFTGSGFTRKLLTLDVKQRTEVCSFSLNFFLSILWKEHELLLKKQPELLKEFENLKKEVEIQLGGTLWSKLYQCYNLSRAHPQIKREYECLMKDIEIELRPQVLNKLDELPASMRSKILKFISKEEIFRILVERKGQSNQDTDTLVTSSGGNVWNRNSSRSEWPNIWLFIYKLNHKPIGYSHIYLDSPLKLNNEASLYHLANKDWTFSYQGFKDIHVSSLFPIGLNNPPNNMLYANKSYFNGWHSLKEWDKENTPDDNYSWIKWE